MIKFIPYIAGFITLIFGYGYYVGLKELTEMNEDIPESEVDI